jgi:hypothetical protein
MDPNYVDPALVAEEPKKKSPWLWVGIGAGVLLICCCLAAVVVVALNWQSISNAF